MLHFLNLEGTCCRADVGFWLRTSLASHFLFLSLSFPICKMVVVGNGKKHALKNSGGREGLN